MQENPPEMAGFLSLGNLHRGLPCCKSRAERFFFGKKDDGAFDKLLGACEQKALFRQKAL